MLKSEMVVLFSMKRDLYDPVFYSNVSIKHLIVMVVTVQYTNTDATQIRHSNIPSPSERCLFQNEQDAVLG